MTHQQVRFNLLQSIDLLSNASGLLADKAIAGFTVNEAELRGARPRMRPWSREYALARLDRSTDEQLATRRLFGRLVTLGEGTEDTRRLATSAEAG